MLSSGCECAPRYVAFLCARLMEVSVEQRAAHIIQKRWRLSRLRSAGAPRDHLNREEPPLLAGLSHLMPFTLTLSSDIAVCCRALSLCRM